MKIPKGWKEIERGTIIKQGDKWWCGWKWSQHVSVGQTVGCINDETNDFTYIRRKSKHPTKKG